MHAVRSLLAVALALFALVLPVVADTHCNRASDCSGFVGIGASCHKGGCYFQSCYALTGYQPSGDCYTTHVFGFPVQNCKCTKTLTGSNYRKRRDVDSCPQQQERCPIFHGRGGFECVDTLNDIESCGGCVGLDGSGPGVDCTNIEGAESVSCIDGSCVIAECTSGLRPTADRSGCLPIAGMRIQKSTKRKFRME